VRHGRAPASYSRGIDASLPRPVVDATWLASRLDDVRVVDVRWYLDGRSGHDAYLAGHIPGAVWVDLDRELSDPPGGDHPGRHPLPSPERFAAAMSRAGVGDTTPVVAYDDAGGSVAARLWWLLHLLEHPVAVLDGGLAAWDGPLSTGPLPPGEAPAPATFTPRPFPPERLADADAVAAVATQPGTVVLDARTAERYAHGDPAIDPRPGHVPGARNAPWAGNLDPGGRFLPPADLRARFAAAGVGDDDRVVAYCGSGVTACHDLLALTLAGRRPEALLLYPGSWSDWGSDPSRPTEVGTPEGGAVGHTSDGE
jgi:thiosulfate/3-mercaptopyruvate sulfurtransferase